MNNSPRDIAAFRRVTNHSMQLNHAQRNCQVCRKRRSVGQFKGDETICAQCLRRSDE